MTESAGRRATTARRAPSARKPATPAEGGRSGAWREPLTGQDAKQNERLSDLERRLVQLERSGQDQARRMAALMIPEETRDHLRRAGREQLLAVRSLLDFWIDRLETGERDRRSPIREEIEVE